MPSLRQIILVIGIYFLVKYSSKIMKRFIEVKKGYDQGVENFRETYDGCDEKEVEGEVIESKIHTDLPPKN